MVSVLAFPQKTQLWLWRFCPFQALQKKFCMRLYSWYFEFDPLFLWGTVCCGGWGVFHIYSRFLEFFEVKHTYKEWMHVFLIFFHSLKQMKNENICLWNLMLPYEFCVCASSQACICLLGLQVSFTDLHWVELLEVQVNGCFVWMLFSILSVAVRVCITHICSFYCWVEDSGVRTLRS